MINVFFCIANTRHKPILNTKLKAVIQLSYNALRTKSVRVRDNSYYTAQSNIVIIRKTINNLQYTYNMIDNNDKGIIHKFQFKLFRNKTWDIYFFLSYLHSVRIIR
jgi:hypothetical protein